MNSNDPKFCKFVQNLILSNNVSNSCFSLYNEHRIQIILIRIPPMFVKIKNKHSSLNILTE